MSYWNNGTRNTKDPSHHRHKTTDLTLLQENHHCGIDLPTKTKSYKTTRQCHLIETFQFDKRTKTNSSRKENHNRPPPSDNAFLPEDLFKDVRSEAYSSDQDGSLPPENDSFSLTSYGHCSSRKQNNVSNLNHPVNFSHEFGDVSTREEQQQIAALIGELEAQTEKVSRAAKAISSSCSRSIDSSIGNNNKMSSSCFASSSANTEEDRERRPSGSTFTWSEQSNFGRTGSDGPSNQQFRETVGSVTNPTADIVQSLLKRTSMGDISKTVDEGEGIAKTSRAVSHETERKDLPKCDDIPNEIPAEKVDPSKLDRTPTQIPHFATAVSLEQNPVAIHPNDTSPENLPSTDITEQNQIASNVPIEKTPTFVTAPTIPQETTHPISIQTPIVENPTTIPPPPEPKPLPSGHVYTNPSSVFGGYGDVPDTTNKRNLLPTSQIQTHSNPSSKSSTPRLSTQQLPPPSSSGPPQDRRLAILECDRNRLQHELAGARRALMSAHSQRVARAAVDREAAAYYDSVARREQAVAKLERELLERENAMTSATTEMKMRLTRQGMEISSLLEQCEWLRKENSRLLENERRWEDHLRAENQGSGCVQDSSESSEERRCLDAEAKIDRYTSTSDGIVIVSPPPTETSNQKDDGEIRMEDASTETEKTPLRKNVFTSTPDGIVHIPSTEERDSKGTIESRNVPPENEKTKQSSTNPILDKIESESTFTSEEEGEEEEEEEEEVESSQELQSTPRPSKKHQKNNNARPHHSRFQTRRREQREDILEEFGRKLVTVRERCERAIQVASGQEKRGIQRCDSGSSLLRQVEDEEANNRIGDHVSAIFNPLFYIVEILGAELDDEEHQTSIRSLEGSIGSQLVLAANAAAKLIASKEHTLADLAALLAENEALMKETERVKASREELNQVKRGLLNNLKVESPNKQMADLVQELTRRGEHDHADRLRDVIQDFREDKRRTLDLVLKLETELAKVVAVHEKTAEISGTHVKETALSVRNMHLEKKLSKTESLLEEYRKQRIEAERSAERRGERLQKFEKRLLAEVEKRKNFEALLREERKKRELVEAREREELIHGGRLRQEEVLRITTQQRQQERNREMEREREREKENVEMEQTLAAVEQERHTWRLMEEAAEKEAEDHRNENAHLRALLDEAKRSVESEYRENVRTPISKPRDDVEEQIRRLTKELQEHERKAEDEEHKALKLRELVKTLKIELNISKEECLKWKNQAKAGIDQSNRRKDVGYLTRAAAGDFVGLEDVAEALGLNDLRNELKREAVNASVQATETAPESEQLIKILKAVQSDSISSTPASLTELGKAVDLQIEQLHKTKEENATLLLEAQKARERRRVREEAWVRKCAALKQRCQDAQEKIQTWEQAGRKYSEMWKDVETHSDADIKIPRNDPSGLCSQCSQRRGGSGQPNMDLSFTIVSKCTCPDNNTLPHPLPFWEYHRNLLSTVQATKHALFRVKAQLEQTRTSDSKHQEELATTKRMLMNVEKEKHDIENQVVELGNITEQMKHDKITLEERLRRVGFGFKTLVLGNGLDMSMDSCCDGESDICSF